LKITNRFLCVLCVLCGESVLLAQDSKSALDTLNGKFALREKTGAPQLQFVAGDGGLVCADVKTPACTGRVYLLGGHVTAWQPAGEEPVIFTSSKSQFAVGKAIRGGVPVCFPWYDGKAQSAVAGIGGTAGPQHGIVRTVEWQVEETRDLGDGAVSVTLITRSNAASKQYWPGDYELREHVVFGKQLQIDLLVKNTGDQPMKYEEDLHSYFFVRDVRKASVLGLDRVEYVDKYDAGKHKKQQGSIALSTPADSIYLGTNGPITIVDDAIGRRMIIDKIDSRDTILWTPGSTRAVSDLGPGEWMNYVTIEVANVGDNSRTVGPGEIESCGFRVSVSK
jgi:D-hexose-6-phosphate mutarotase